MNETHRLTASIKRTRKPVVAFTADGTAMPKLLRGREDEGGPSAHSGIVTGSMGRPAKSEAIISLRWSYCQKQLNVPFKGKAVGACIPRLSGGLFKEGYRRQFSTWALSFTARAEMNFADGKSFLLMLLIKVFSPST